MITPAIIPAINPMFRLQWEQAQDCFVLLFPEGMVKLNGGAGEIMQLIDGNKNVEQIVAALMVKFSDAGDLSVDVNEFLTTASEKKWIFHE